MTIISATSPASPVFQSTCHIRGMTDTYISHVQSGGFQSTCHIRGMTDGKRYDVTAKTISIHMPHTWHDVRRKLENCFAHNISIHMPHTCHDNTVGLSYGIYALFQSTCHIRGMTFMGHKSIATTTHFNPHATYVA